MNERDRLLLEVLALTDAAWLPPRTRMGNQGPNTWALRHGFAQGLPWAAGGAEADRKSANRLRTDLVTEGLLQAFHPKRKRVVHLKLTEAAELALRRRVGLPGRFGAWLSCQDLARRSVRPATRMEHAWVCERALIGDKFKPRSREEAREAATVEQLLLWAFPRQLVEGLGTTLGLVYYRLLDAGWSWLDAGQAPPDDDFAPVEETDQPARDFYEERLKVNLERLVTATPEEPSEIGFIPLPDGGMVGPL